MSTVAIVPQSTGVHETIILSDRHGASRINGDVTIIALFEGEEMIQPGRQGEYNSQTGRYEMLPPMMGKIVCALVRRNTESELQKAIERAANAEERQATLQEQMDTFNREAIEARKKAAEDIQRLSACIKDLGDQRQARDEAEKRLRRLESDLAKLRNHFGQKAFDEALATEAP